MASGIADYKVARAAYRHLTREGKAASFGRVAGSHTVYQVVVNGQGIGKAELAALGLTVAPD